MRFVKRALRAELTTRDFYVLFGIVAFCLVLSCLGLVVSVLT